MLRYNSSTARIVDLVKDHHLWLAGGPCDASVVNLSDPALPDSLLAKTVEIFFEGQVLHLGPQETPKHHSALLPIRT